MTELERKLEQICGMLYTADEKLSRIESRVADAAIPSMSERGCLEWLVNCWCGAHGDCDACPVRGDREGYSICQFTGFEDLDVTDLKVVARLFLKEDKG